MLGLSSRRAVCLFAVAACAVMSGTAWADGTQTLGDPVGITVATGTDVIVAGKGLIDAQPGSINIDIPADVTVKQVLLYWEGQETSESGQGATDDILVEGLPVVGQRIGGASFFFQTSDIYVWSSSYRADITALGLVTNGSNSIEIDGLDFDYANDGAGLLVIVDDGITTADIDLRDGNDCAFYLFYSPNDITEPVVYEFAADTVDRDARLSLFVASVSHPRPSVIRVWQDDVLIQEIVDELDSNDGNEWDSDLIDVTIPAGSTKLTVQLFSEDAGTGEFAGNMPASMTWVVSNLTLYQPMAECTGMIGDKVWEDTNENGCQDDDELGIVGVTVNLYDACQGGIMIDSTVTDENGEYSFTGLCAGQYRVEIVAPAGYVETEADASCTGGDEDDSDCVNGSICVTLPDDDTVDLTNDCGLYIPDGGEEGCTIGFWKNHLKKWCATGYSPWDKVGDVFILPDEMASLADKTLYEALRLKGGSQLTDKAALLLKQAVAAVLNAAHPNVEYGIIDPLAVIDAVNVALATLDAGQIMDLQGALDELNNSDCPLSGKCKKGKWGKGKPGKWWKNNKHNHCEKVKNFLKKKWNSCRSQVENKWNHCDNDWEKSWNNSSNNNWKNNWKGNNSWKGWGSRNCRR